MKTWWGFLAFLIAACQIVTLLYLVSRYDDVDKLAAINEQTVMMNNEAASLNLDTERRRNNYYRVLENVMRDN